jgi:hypothetical protein
LSLPELPRPSPFVCPRCGAISHNPHDAAERYCGRCHVFVDDETSLNFLALALDALDACRKSP